ncbi:DinB family protein [Pseudoxanthomonas mexicana]|uniref:DinB family protein n=1 Tax=Pseudoxanthomonas mexicana TaxID=128785 RepID=UPI0021AF2E69|nr:DinB family protein [Pseudoxanthomonas mexicana]
MAGCLDPALGGRPHAGAGGVPPDLHQLEGATFTRSVEGLLTHLFNHQTHHRGQVTTLLSQAGVDVGVTDLLALLPDEA